MRPPIEYGARSNRQAKDWVCGGCGHQNGTVRKLIFDVPVWDCASCQRKFLDDKQLLDFCLADVLVNEEKLIKHVFEQVGPTCTANAICQAIQIIYILDCILNEVEPEAKMRQLHPRLLVDWYDNRYPHFGSKTINFGTAHTTCKMLLKLIHEGMPFEDGSTPYKLGDVTTIDIDDYEALCDEFADGVPLVCSFEVGISFEDLGYCLIYAAPNPYDSDDCRNDRHFHASHTVVLLGPACNGIQRGFYFINSYGLWAPRFVLDEGFDYGVAKVSTSGLNMQAIKLWLPGEGNRPSARSLVDEDEDDDITDENKELLYGHFFSVW